MKRQAVSVPCHWGNLALPVLKKNAGQLLLDRPIHPQWTRKTTKAAYPLRIKERINLQKYRHGGEEYWYHAGHADTS